MNKIRLILLCVSLSVTLSCGQQIQSDCQKRMDFLNDNIDEFAFSFTGRIKEIKILEKEFITNPSTETTRTIKFDETGRINETYLSNEKIKMFGRTVYSYNSNNQIVKKAGYNPDGSASGEFVYSYTPEGNLQSSINQNSNGKIIIWKNEYKYESPDSYVEYSDGKFARRIKLKKDDRCRVIETRTSKEDGKLLNKLTQKYDDRNNLIELIIYSPEGIPIEKSKSEYEYDTHGNWVKQNYYDWSYDDGDAPYKLKKTRTLTITYLNAN